MPTDQQGPDPTRTALAKASEAAARGDINGVLMWALLSVAEDVAQIRRDLHWQRNQGGRRG